MSVNTASLSVPSAAVEGEDFSDSDWLDVTSSHDESDAESLPIHEESDTDSLAISIREHASSRSRRSSYSIDSESLDGWEGFVDDGVDVPPTDIPIFRDEPSDADRRVNDALDQGMASTLSASHTDTASCGSLHASTVQNSSNDLRLSFPDPLAHAADGSQASLTIVPDVARLVVEDESTHSDDSESYEPGPDVVELPFNKSEEILGSLVELHLVAVDEAQDRGDATVDNAHDSMSDPGALPTPEVPQSEPEGVDMRIYTYGVSSWPFIDKLIHKYAEGSDRVVIDTTPFPLKRTTFYTLESPDGGSHTIAAVEDAVEPEVKRDIPSLALIFASCAPPVLPDDLDFLFIRPSSATGFELPRHGRLLRIANHDSIIESDLDNVTPKAVHETIATCFSPRSDVSSNENEAITPVISRNVTIFTVMSLILGCVMSLHGYLPFSASGPPSTPVTSVATSFTSLNFSSSPSSIAAAPAALITSSLKDLALSVFNPSISIAHPDVSPSTISSKGGSKTHLSTDLAVLGVTSISVTSSVSSTASIAAKLVTSTALSVRLVETLKEIADIPVKDLADVSLKDVVATIRRDVDELNNRLGEAINRHFTSLEDASKTIRDELRHRNDRARGNAKALKQRAFDIFSTASDRVRESGRHLFNAADEHMQKKVSTARKRARGVKEGLSRNLAH